MLRKSLFLSLVLAAQPVLLSWASAGAIDVIPQPQLVTTGAGSFSLNAATRIVVSPNSPAATAAANALVDRLHVGTGLSPATSEGTTASSKSIFFTTQGVDAALGNEGYVLDVTPESITISGQAAGLFYGVQTLLQLMPPTVFGLKPSKNADVDWSIPAVHITDVPRFKWRGVLFDVARHFEPKSDVLRLLDQMAMHKLNVLHWHLTDDQGWRLEIKKYPKLTSIGAWRDSAGFEMDPKLSTTYGPDGKYGGFYTQDDVREVLAAAALRHIVVMPEIEMPGHASAALRAYPEFFAPYSAPDPTQVKGDAGCFNAVYDPANEKTFGFVQDVLSEVIDLFPSEYIHIGGDEVLKGPWQNNPPDVAFMKAKGLAGPEQLQSYFVQRVGKFISSKGRRMIGWDEILEGGLAPDATVMNWHGSEGGKAAAAAGHDVVMTQSTFTYLDNEQTSQEGTEPHTRGYVIPVQKVYSFEPVPADLPAEQTKYILGLQGNLWTEYVPNMPWAEYLIWPRAAAVAEVGWTPAANRNWEDFARRLVVDQQRLDAMGVNYRPIENDNLTHAIHLDQQTKVVIDSLPGTTTRFTMDGSTPTRDSAVYNAPIALPSGWVQVAARYYQPGKVAAEAAAATFLDGRPVTVSATSAKDWDTRKIYFYTPRFGGGPGDTVTTTFDAGPQIIPGITVTTGDPSIPGSSLTHGALEMSYDGKAFDQVAEFGADGTAHTKSDQKPVAAFRIRFTVKQKTPPIIMSVKLQP